MTAHVLAMPRQSVGVDLPSAKTTSPLLTSVIRALLRTGMTQGEIAEFLHCSPQTWSKKKAGVDGHKLHVQGLDGLPERYRDLFLDALVDELAHVRGRTVVAPGGHLPHLANTMRSLADTLEALAVQTALPFGKVVGE